MHKYSLTNKQIKKLEDYYKVPITELEVDSTGLIVVQDNIPSHLKDFVKEIKSNLKDGDHIIIKTKKDRPNYKEAKELIELLGTNKISGDGLGSFFKNAWNKTKEFATDAFNKITTRAVGDLYNKGKELSEVTPVINSDHMPDLKTLYQMENASYKPEEGIDRLSSWRLIENDQYIGAYKDDNSKTIIIAIRGTDPKDSGDIAADIGIALGSLKVSDRYKRDLRVIRRLQTVYKPTEWWYAGVGHSLGGALLDEFIKLGLLNEGVSFNPAVSKEDYNLPTTNRRIYLDSDPLYNLMGRFTSNHEVRKSNKGPLASHELKNFEGGKSPDGSNLVLHAVIIKKPVDFEQARKISREFIKDPKKKFVRETGASYRFRNFPKQQFKPYSFVTKKVKKGVSLIFGVKKD